MPLIKKEKVIIMKYLRKDWIEVIVMSCFKLIRIVFWSIWKKKGGSRKIRSSVMSRCLSLLSLWKVILVCKFLLRLVVALKGFRLGPDFYELDVSIIWLYFVFKYERALFC